jgi:ATP-dependent Lon protease
MYEQTSQLSEVAFLQKKVEEASIPSGLKEKIDLILTRLRRMARQNQSAGEYEAVAKYIDWCLRIPWNNVHEDNLDLPNAKRVMDERHYGGEDVKQVILEYLAILNRKKQLRNSDYVSPVLAFVGVQGAGKTTLAKAVAKAMVRPFYRISLGALGESKELRGSPFGQTSSHPGQVIRALAQTQCMNPVILLDEFDKVSGSDAARKDFMAILLEILDPQQNNTFRDWFIDYPVDLSKVLFIATANSFRTISRELLDRLEYVEFNDYTPEEKIVIAKKFLLPQVYEYAGLRPEEFQITEDAWPVIIQEFGKDEGVRRLERNLQRIARKVIKQIVIGQIKGAVINADIAMKLAQTTARSIEEVRNIDYTGTSDL